MTVAPWGCIRARLSANMPVVHLFLVAVFVIQAAGIPAVAETPCAALARRGEVCCVRHQTEDGSPVVGHCGCRPADEPVSGIASPSTPTPKQETVGATASVALPVSAVPLPGPGSWRASVRAGAPGESPPRLSGSGFRC